MHHFRWLEHGSTNDPTPTTEQRFWAKVDKSGECWMWTGSKLEAGYGRFFVNGKHTGAHRFAYELARGAIPAGYQIDHLCFTPSCVRADHLRVVTARENVLASRNPTAQNAAKTHCKHGHPFSAENTYWRGSWRRCRACERMREANKKAVV